VTTVTNSVLPTTTQQVLPAAQPVFPTATTFGQAPTQLPFQSNLAATGVAPGTSHSHSHTHQNAAALPGVPSNLIGTNLSQFGFAPPQPPAPLYPPFNMASIFQDTPSSTPTIGTSFPGTSSAATIPSLSCLEAALATPAALAPADATARPATVVGADQSKNF